MSAKAQLATIKHGSQNKISNLIWNVRAPSAPVSTIVATGWDKAINMLLRLGFLSAVFLSFMGEVKADPYDTVVLQGLDKVTARVSRLETPVGQFVRFGTLDIVARTCDKRPPEETPESAAFLDISESKPGEPATEVFRGWMFASSPGLNSMEHPVYDVWVLDCKNMASSSADNSELVGSE